MDIAVRETELHYRPTEVQGHLRLADLRAQYFRLQYSASDWWAEAGGSGPARHPRSAWRGLRAAKLAEAAVFLALAAVPFAPLEPEFAKRGVIVRPLAGWGFVSAFRVSVGTHPENLRFLGVLDEIRATGLFGPSGAPR